MYGTSWCECVFSGNKNGINNPSWIGSTPHTNLRSHKWETCYSDGSDICWDETKHNECGVCFFIMHPMKVPVYRNQSFVLQSMSWSMWTTVVLYGCTFGSFVADNTDMTIFYASRVSDFLGKTSQSSTSFIHLFLNVCFLHAPLLSRMEPVTLNFPRNFELLSSLEHTYQFGDTSCRICK